MVPYWVVHLHGISYYLMSQFASCNLLSNPINKTHDVMAKIQAYTMELESEVAKLKETNEELRKKQVHISS